MNSKSYYNFRTLVVTLDCFYLFKNEKLKDGPKESLKRKILFKDLNMIHYNDSNYICVVYRDEKGRLESEVWNLSHWGLLMNDLKTKFIKKNFQNIL